MPVDHAPEFIMGELVGEARIGPFSFRVYVTNADPNATLTKAFCDNYHVLMTEGSKGHATFRVPGFPNKVQLMFKHGFMIIFGGQGNDDYKILRTLSPEVKTNDGLPFQWCLKQKYVGAKEARAQLLRLSKILDDMIKIHSQS